MSKVIVDMTMSLDGFIAGSSPDGDLELLHTWVIDQDPADTEVLRQATADTGAVIMGRTPFDTVRHRRRPARLD